MRRRPVLIGADWGRALLLGSIPLAAALGLLRIEYLYLVAVLATALTVCFNVAADSYLPALIPRGQLVAGNSKLAASESLAQIAGPGVGGVLVQVITAPLALLVDAGSFFGIGAVPPIYPHRRAGPHPRAIRNSVSGTRSARDYACWRESRCCGPLLAARASSTASAPSSMRSSISTPCATWRCHRHYWARSTRWAALLGCLAQC